jgi:hypothetical protein
MLYYPQLSSGSVCQFPITRQTAMRTIRNDLLSGASIRMSDPGAALVGWQLQYSSLIDNEWLAIEQLFEAVEGQLSAFTFLDPTDNLLMWSEDWTKSAWTADPPVQLSTGVADPFGGSNAMQITNTSQTLQRVVQSTNAPSWFQYCVSVFLRSNAPATVQFVLETTGHQLLAPIQVGSTWSRAMSAATLATQADGIGFGLQLPAGVSIQAFGAQVEAQPTAGPYKKTIDRGGVYPTTRFDSDSLVRSTIAPNLHSGNVKLVSKLA